jgi:hypothetical protein
MRLWNAEAVKAAEEGLYFFASFAASAFDRRNPRSSLPANLDRGIIRGSSIAA